MEGCVMGSGITDILVRPASIEDVSQMCELLNEIIQAGGTTAIEMPLNSDEFIDHYLRSEGHINCCLAEYENGPVLGFQLLQRREKLPAGWADIATYARIRPKVRGIGTALFSYSKTYAEEVGIVGINATIRADNSGGIAYYEKMGFRTYSIAKDVPLANGRLADRVSKRLLLG
jgi:L-amino acid N-acyltransferase YncA